MKLLLNNKIYNYKLKQVREFYSDDTIWIVYININGGKEVVVKKLKTLQEAKDYCISLPGRIF